MNIGENESIAFFLNLFDELIFFFNFKYGENLKVLKI